jgi:molecular chaperone GrpE
LRPFGKLKAVEDQNLNANISDVSADAPESRGNENNLPAETLEGQLAAVTAERDQLAAEKAELYDRVLRARAEFENARRRAERDRLDYVQFAAMDLVKDILPILDDFERALKVPTADTEYAKGVELIYQRMYDTLKRLGLEPIEAKGKPFDPNLHQAVDRVHTEEADDMTVLDEFQRGYNFKGKLLRPSMVKVAVRP